MWDQRYDGDDYAYGKLPNDFLKEKFDRLTSGSVLCLAEGEGRNAVWLAQQGVKVTAVDSSEVGLKKARRLAQERGVSITTLHVDLKDFEIGLNQWDYIVSIFCHLPPDIRKLVHQRCVNGLRLGGKMLLEAYTPKQLEYKTGGPPVAEMMMDSDILSSELNGLEFIDLSEKIRQIHEGEFHNGKGAVVQLIARKP